MGQANMNIQNKTVLVTGANRGVGSALVEQLIEQGAAKVYAAVRHLETMPKITHPNVVPILLDVTNERTIAQAAKLAVDCQVVINNAGTLSFGDILSVSKEDIEVNFAVNCFGLLLVAKYFAPILEKNNGAIVNVLTLLSFASMPGMAAYNASKAAAWSMHLSLRATLAEKGVFVHGVFPGAIDTDMLAGVEMDKASPKDIAVAIIEGVSNQQEDIFPDAMSKQVYAAWVEDHKAVEKQFAQM